MWRWSGQSAIGPRQDARYVVSGSYGLFREPQRRREIGYKPLADSNADPAGGCSPATRSLGPTAEREKTENKIGDSFPLSNKEEPKKTVAPLTLGQEAYDVSRCPTFPNGVAHATSLKADSEEPALFGTHAGRAKR